MRSQSVPVRSRLQLQLALAAAALSALLVATLSQGLYAPRQAPAPAPAGQPATAFASSTSLPLAAQGPISATLGAQAPAYRVRTVKGTPQARNPAQDMNVRFGQAGVSLSAGALKVALRLRAGAAHQPSATGSHSSAGFDGAPAGFDAIPASAGRTARANRVVYSHPGLSGLREWYANGPLGLEQGFTIPHALRSGEPGTGEVGALTLSMAISGNAHVSLDAQRQSVVFTHAARSLRYGGLIATDATGRKLDSRLALQAGQLQIRVDTRSARYPLQIDPLIQQGAKLTGADEDGEGQFGLSVALSANGNTALVAGSHDDDFAGSVWAFTRSAGVWAQQGGKLTSNETGGAEEGCDVEAEQAGECGFGRGLSLSADGNTALIGAPRTGDGQGAVFVFTRSGSTWSKHSKLSEPSEEGREAHLGRSVAVSGDGNTALIGAPADKSGRGAAWVFTRSGSSWKQQGAKLTAPGAVTETHFGGSVALSSSGDAALVGGPGDSGYRGAVWAFARSGSSWGQQGGKLTANDEQGEGHLGSSVTMSADGQTAVIGGRADNDGIGAAWVFATTGAAWTQQGPKLTGANEVGAGEFGYSVAISADGNTALIGAPRDNLLSGAVRVFTRSGFAWTQQPEQLAGAEQLGNSWVGASVASSEDASTALIGAPHDDGRLGAAWPFAFQVAPTMPPTVSKVSPNSGPGSGGTTVTINGTNFTSASAVSFGVTGATSYTVRSATTIVAVSPPGEGTVDVTVSTPSGTSAVSPPDTRFRFLAGGPGGPSPVAPTGPATLGGSGGTLGFGPLAGGASAACRISLSGRTITVQRRNRATLRLLRTGIGSCRGKLTLSYKAQIKGKRFKLKPIATASFSIPPGKSRLVTVTLNRTGRSLLRKGHGKLDASLAILRLSPAPRQARTASVKLKLRTVSRAAKPRH